MNIFIPVFGVIITLCFLGGMLYVFFAKLVPAGQKEEADREQRERSKDLLDFQNECQKVRELGKAVTDSDALYTRKVGTARITIQKKNPVLLNVLEKTDKVTITDGIFKELVHHQNIAIPNFAKAVFPSLADSKPGEKKEELKKPEPSKTSGTKPTSGKPGASTRK